MSLPAAPGNTNNVNVPVRTFNEVKTVSLAFVGDHALLKDNAADWTASGNPIAKPEFTFGRKSAPVSRTKANYLAVKVELEVWPYDAPQMQCTIKGAASWGQSFETKFPLKGGKQTVVVESAEKLPDRTVKLAGDIEWTVDNGADGAMKADRSWGHALYLTIDTPIDLTATREAGITDKHMMTAVDLVGRSGALDPHAIVGWLMGQIPGYTLQPNPAVPAAFSHPTYFNTVGGAWPLADWLSYRAECQAICRFVSAVIKQVGCPGTAEVMVVWADPDVDSGNTALEATWASGGGLARKPTRMINGDPCNATLVDSHVEEGAEYQIDNESGAGYVGCNNFEACLRFEHNGVKKYYGGGAGTYGSAQEVLTAFHALVWICVRADMQGHRFARVVQVVKRWRDASGNLIR